MTDKPKWGGRRTGQTGRPPKPDALIKTSVQLSRAQLDKLNALAAERGVTMPEVLRDAVAALPEPKTAAPRVPALKPTGRGAQQLMSLLWAEEHAPLSKGKVFASTRPLIQSGLLVKDEDTLTVTLSPAGRAEAERLSRTAAGQAFMAELERAPDAQNP